MLFRSGPAAIVWHGLLPTTLAIVGSPLIGFLLALLMVLILSWMFVRSTPFAVDRTFQHLQFVCAWFDSLGLGGTVAQMLALRDYADVILVDIVEGLPQGKALDLMESGPLLGYDTALTGANDYAATASSDVVVITSGIARKPGMSRDDLLKTNRGIV